MPPKQQRRAEQLTSLFENDSLQIRYDYAENLDDGRGITCGRVGFTTATGDALAVVQLYSQKVPNNPLTHFLPTLKKLAKEESDDTGDLNGFIKAWQQCAKDATFRAVQDQVVDKLYYEPSARYADQLGLQTALTRAVLHDSIIQHGDGDDPDSLSAILKRTQKSAGGTPKTGVNERVWLKYLLEQRRATLTHAHNKETRQVWAEAAGRCDVFQAIAEAGNYNLDGPIKINTQEYKPTIV